MSTSTTPIAFDLALAQRAHSGTSFDPDKRAVQEQQEHDAHLNAIRAELSGLVQNDDQRAIYEAGIASYAEGYTRRYHAYLSARSRCLSTMIAGPANFNTRRNDRAFRVEQGRTQELNEYTKKAGDRLKRAILDARTPDQLDAEMLRRLTRWIDRDMAICAGIDSGAEFYNRSAFVNSAAGKLRREIVNGNAPIVAQALEYIERTQETMIAAGQLARPFISKRHGVWKECADALALAALAPATPEAAPDEDGEILIAECDAARAIRNRAIDRVQIIFPGKPGEEIRRELRGSGWNWSPTNGAWQRKDTPNAVAVATRLIESMS